MRKPLIAGNWKMHGSLSQVRSLLNGILSGAASYRAVDILVCPTFVHLAEASQLMLNASVLLGAQNLYLGAQGAFTGEISAPMLKDIGCQFVIIGHSERRTIFGETDELVAAKFKAALDASLIPILCVGETKEEREEGATEVVIKRQLDAVLHHAGIEGFARAVIAYEPVWAIGTGLTATPQQAQDVHAYIRHILSQNNVDIARTIRILYGGSMKAENASSLLAMPDIDGGLIGGAALDANSFLAICAAAEKEVTAAN